jgi:hypothetical protein
VKALVLLLLALIAPLLGCEQEQRPVAADEIDCVKWDDAGRNCMQAVNIGTWSISVNAGANACSIMMEIRRTKEQGHERTQSLSYVDEDNWECRTMPDENNIQLVARMSHGTLAMERQDLDSSAVVERFNIRRRGTLDDIEAALNIGTRQFAAAPAQSPGASDK